MAALQGAKVPGADTRCLDEGISTLSSFLRVAEPGDTLGTLSIDLNVRSVVTDWSVDPIDSLQTLFDAAVGCFGVGVPAISEPQLQIHTFPDPAKNFFFVTSSSAIRQILVVDPASGAILENKVVGLTTASKIFCDQFSAGVKLVKVVLKDGTVAVTKVVIQ